MMLINIFRENAVWVIQLEQIGEEDRFGVFILLEA